MRGKPVNIRIVQFFRIIQFCQITELRPLFNRRQIVYGKCIHLSVSQNFFSRNFTNEAANLFGSQTTKIPCQGRKTNCEFLFPGILSRLIICLRDFPAR